MLLPQSDQSRLAVSLGSCRQLDQQQIVFGQLIEGGAVLKALNSLPVRAETCAPLAPVVVTGSGPHGIESKDERQSQKNDEKQSRKREAHSVIMQGASEEALQVATDNRAVRDSMAEALTKGLKKQKKQKQQEIVADETETEIEDLLGPC